MTIDPNLEDRLSRELRRSAPTSVPVAPPVSEMESAVAGRRRRNRIISGAAAAILVFGVAGGVVLANLPDSSTDVISSAPDDSSTTVPDTAADSIPDDSVTENDGAVADGTDVVEPSDPGDDGSIVSAPSADTTEIRAIEPDGAVSLQTQDSAVDFAGGSGVFVVSQGDGYSGIAGRFGGAAGINAIGLRSADGLNWEEVELSGVPEGATATALTSFGETTVALFSQFDVDEQRNVTFVGTSTDLAEWTLAPALPGPDSIAMGLAVGPPGVLVLGVAPSPMVWTGPVGGPYEQVGAIDAADTLAGVVAVDNGFVAVGTTSDLGATLFDSVDGASWNANSISLAAADNVVGLSVMNGTILLAGDGADVGWSATSNDGGQTWIRSEFDAASVSSVRSGGSTVGFLSTSASGSSTVTLSDGQSWSSTDLGIEAPSRVELLASDSDQAVLLATIDDALTWIVAMR